MLKEREVEFEENQKAGIQISETSQGKKCQFTLFGFADPNNHRTVFLSKPVHEGIFKWTIRVSYGSKDSGALMVGAAPASSRRQFDSGMLLGASTEENNYALHFGKETTTRLWVDGKARAQLDEIEVPENSLVAVELDADTHMLSFFVDEKFISHAIRVVPEALHIGASGTNCPSFTTVSFCQLAQKTSSDNFTLYTSTPKQPTVDVSMPMDNQDTNTRVGELKNYPHEGDLYEGEYTFYRPHGRGSCLYKSKQRYEGQWVNGVREGEGVYTWPSGQRYVGHYERGKRVGYGELTFSDGRIYKGNWLDDKREGQGVELDREGEVLYEGKYVNGEPENAPKKEPKKMEGCCTVM